ncbi:MAG: hypothetical protein LBL71_02565, partial [Endomicrobium sp.]|nr:hypothetical protein [Endomicrobium sp.]
MKKTTLVLAIVLMLNVLMPLKVWSVPDFIKAGIILTINEIFWITFRKKLRSSIKSSVNRSFVLIMYYIHHGQDEMLLATNADVYEEEIFYANIRDIGVNFLTFVSINSIGWILYYFYLKISNYYNNKKHTKEIENKENIAWTTCKQKTKYIRNGI